MEHLVRGLPLERAMAPFVVVPFVVPVQDYLRVVDRIELVPVDHLPLQIGVERLDVGVVLL